MKIFNPADSRAVVIRSSCLVLAMAAVCSAGAQATFTSVPQSVLAVTQRSNDLGHMTSSQLLHIVVCLKPANPAALQAYADSVSDPASPNYGHFLTPKQNGQFFGQPDAVVNQVTSYFKSLGMSVRLVADSHLAIAVDGTVAQAEAAFQTNIEKYHARSVSEPGRQDYYAYSKPIKVPSAFASAIQSISNLENFSKPKPMILDPTSTRSLYDVAPFYKIGQQGQGRTLGIGNYDGYRLSNVPLYYQQYSLPTPPGGVGANISVKTINGGSGSGSPAGEGDLDIQMVLGMAPLCSFVIYDSTDAVSTLMQVAQDNLVDVIGESYGFGVDDSTATALHNLHLTLTTQGITYLNASGDSGTSTVSVDQYGYPDFEPEALVVGGTIATVTGTGTRASEVGWSGSGGGWDPAAASNFNTLPSWQTGPGVPTTIPYRLVPDVALNAAGDPGAYYFYYGGVLTDDYDGTSFACPNLIGQLGIAEEALIKKGAIKVSNGKYRLGRISTRLYSFGAQANRASIFYDVTSGDNGMLPDGTESTAKANWDFVTGLGVLDIAGLVNAFPVAIPTSNYAPVTIGIYSSQGTNPQGTPASVSSTNSIYYTLQSVSSNIGQVSSPSFTYALPTTGTINSLVINVTTLVPRSATNFVYMYNYVTGLYDLINSSAGTGANVTQALSVPNFANYISSTGSVVIVDRALYPTRLGNIPFTFKVDQMTLGTN